MEYLKRFYEEHHFEEMVPYDLAEAEESISPFANKLAAATISRDKTRALIYYGEMDGMSTPLAGLCDGIYAISWFDPRTGQTEKAEIQVEVRGKLCIMPKKPAAGDWVLIAECIEKLKSDHKLYKMRKETAEKCKFIAGLFFFGGKKADIIRSSNESRPKLRNEIKQQDKKIKSEDERMKKK